MFSCKDKGQIDLRVKEEVVNSVEVDKDDKVVTTADKIAEANGLENWSEVSEIQFTFNVEKGENHSERTWVWRPIEDKVTMLTQNDTTTYFRHAIDSISKSADRAFINDKFWLLAAFNLVWDDNTSFTEEVAVESPVHKIKMNKLTVLYGSEGGYTPGDAYDFYYDENYILQEWSYRRANADASSLSTTWEDYETFEGIEISKMRRNIEGGFKLYFTNIQIKKLTEFKDKHSLNSKDLP